MGVVRPRERVGSKEMNINTTLAELHNEKWEEKLLLVIKNKQEGVLSQKGTRYPIKSGEAFFPRVTNAHSKTME